MRLFSLLIFASAMFGVSAPAMAQHVSVHGMATGRIVAPSDEISWREGGFGRLRYGAADDENIYLSDLYLEPRIQATSALSFFAMLKRDPEQIEPIDIIEGFVQYKPVSTSSLQWSLKAGAFFPPISFENGDIGWTNPYTVTSSAINSWLGEELRIIGAEASVTLRAQDYEAKAFGSLFGWNDPLGVLLAVRGWGLTDRSTGLLDRVRLHDGFAVSSGHTPPYTESETREIDDRVGWYLGGEYARRSGLKLRVLYYDNRADPAAVRNGQQAWLTRFWSAGAEYPFGQWTLIAQGMTGFTDIDKTAASGYLHTDFSSAFLLVARDIGDIRLSGRAEFFRTDESADVVKQLRKEDGGAFTLAARWFLSDHIQIAAEGLYVESDRPERLGASLPVEATELQFQTTVQLRF